MVTTIDPNTRDSGDSRSPMLHIQAYSQVGQWLLIIGPHSIRNVMMNLIAGLAEQEPVRVVQTAATERYRREIVLPSPDLQRLFSNFEKRKK